MKTLLMLFDTTGESNMSPLSTFRRTSKRLSLWAIACSFVCINSLHAQSTSVGVKLPNIKEVHSPLLLKAVTDPATGKSVFSFAGEEVPPVIRAAPGSKITIDLSNELSTHSREKCVDGACQNMTNLHFHGLHVSPNAPQDDVISMMAMPGESLHYVVDIPLDQPPGLYWYHTHPHGESYQQALDGMSGAIVIEGIERYAPEVAKITEQILVLRDFDLTTDPSSASQMIKAVNLSPAPCGKASGEPQRIFTVNGAIRPKITIAPGERQFWRIVNASPDLYADLAVDSSNLTVVAIDGMPLAFHDPHRHSVELNHILLPPAGRVEAIVRGSLDGRASLRSRCIDTGQAGDPNLAMVIADLDLRQNDGAIQSRETPMTTRTRPRPISVGIIRKAADSQPAFVVRFTEDQRGFYINGKKYGADSPPMTVVRTGHLVHWRVVNNTDEIHPFHIHQVHFLVYAVNGKRLIDPVWQDTSNVPVRGEVDLVMDFTDPVIKGLSVFHCHLLKHEDKGMMAKILFR